MTDTRYNLIAGGSVERIAALSDGVFAVAMTLLVLDLKAPAAELVHTDAALATALLDIAPRLAVFLLSFLTLGIFWVGQQAQLTYLDRSDRHLSWLHLIFLFFICLMPFSTTLMAEFLRLRLALALYWLNILALGLALLATWTRAARANLLKPDATPEIQAAICRRIKIAQALYAAAAALCVIDTLLSLGCIVVIQLFYALGPTRGPLSKI